MITDSQRQLARHALGLPNKQRRSYRNRYHATMGGEKHKAWLDMVNAGLATYWPQRGSRVDLFTLTIVGASLALLPGESLDPEDFPEARAMA